MYSPAALSALRLYDFARRLPHRPMTLSSPDVRMLASLSRFNVLPPDMASSASVTLRSVELMCCLNSPSALSASRASTAASRLLVLVVLAPRRLAVAGGPAPVALGVSKSMSARSSSSGDVQRRVRFRWKARWRADQSSSSARGPSPRRRSASASAWAAATAALPGVRRRASWSRAAPRIRPAGARAQVATPSAVSGATRKPRFSSDATSPWPDSRFSASRSGLLLTSKRRVSSSTRSRAPGAKSPRTSARRKSR